MDPFPTKLQLKLVKGTDPTSGKTLYTNETISNIRTAATAWKIVPGRSRPRSSRDDPCDINQLLDDLAAADHLILRYQVEGRRLIQVATFEKHQHVSEKEKRSECYPPPPEWRQAEPVSSGAQQGSPRAEPVVKEGSLQADAGTNLVSSRNEPGTTPAASQDQPRSPFSTALPHTALPSENISLCARRKSENARTYVPSFELFWQEYPSHIDKRHAFGCWKARLKEGIAGDLLAACTGHYAAARRGEDERYTMHPSTFLGPGRRWEEFLIHPNESTRGRFIGDPLQPKARGGNSRLVGAGLKPALTWTDEELPAFSPAARAWLDLPTNGERKVADE